MEYIRVAKVECDILHHGRPDPGTLHLTAHHLIFRRKSPEQLPPTSEQKATLQLPPKEIWIAYPIIGTALRYPPSAAAPAHIRLRNRDFSFVTLRFDTDRECRDVFESIKALTIIKGGVEKLYAFFYQPMAVERKCDGWAVYDPLREFSRMGVGTERGKGWRITKINKDYTFSPTYPAQLVVPAAISDTTLTHAKNYRSRARIPALTYLHSLNNCCIARCAQPLTGLRGNRSIQDEKLVAAIFASSQPACSQTPAHLASSTPSPSGSSTDLPTLASNTSSMSDTSPTEGQPSRVYGAQQRNLIVDARPTVNAYAMQAVGMGSENMDNYRHVSSPPCQKQYLGIDNIHVMRESLNKVIEAIKDSDITPLPPNREQLAKSGWLKHIGLLLDGTSVIVRQIALEHAHVLLHCSDGWDRTSQLSSLAQICLDPYFRTIDGFMVLVEKDWVSFGHRFRDRCGSLGHEKWFVEKSGNGPPAAEDPLFDDDDPTLQRGGIGDSPFLGLGGSQGGGAPAAFTDALSTAKNFFSNVSNSANGRSSSPSASEMLEGEFDPNSPSVDRRTKAASAINAHTIKPKEVSPMFQQFLDATYQLMYQNPTRFEYNERFLRRLLFHLYSCQYGTFLYNNDKERLDAKVKERTRSVWDYFLARRKMWINEDYDPGADGHDRDREAGGGQVLFPQPGSTSVRWWAHCWGREDGEMNGNALHLGVQQQEPRTASAVTAGTAVSGVVDGVRGLALGKNSPSRNRENALEVEMM